MIDTLTPEETAAMWLYGEDYAQSGLDPRGYYHQLSEYRRHNIADFVEEMREALERQAALVDAEQEE